MLLWIGLVIETLVSLFVNFFTTFYVIGRFLICVLTKSSEIACQLFSLIYNFACVFYEDIKIFIADIDYQYSHIIRMFNNGLSNSVNDIIGLAQATSNSTIWIIERSKYETFNFFNQLADLFGKSATGIRDSTILIGNSVWMLLMFIPNMTVFIVNKIISFSTTFSISVAETIKCLITNASNSISVTVKFFASVPLQSIFGLILAFLIIRNRRYVFKLLWSVLRSADVLLFILKLSSMQLIQLVIKFFSTTYGNLSAFGRWCARIQNYLPSLSFLKLSDVKESNQTNDLCNLCIICQDELKSVVLLPCRHLCLCQSCFQKLKRYGRFCPICREPFQHTMQVYV